METRSMLTAAATHYNKCNTFLYVLDRTPALLCSCSRLDKPIQFGDASLQDSGCLKTLRLVSQGARAAASHAVTSFELTLDCKPGRDMCQMAHLFQGACLQRFGVRVINTMVPQCGRKHAENQEVSCVQALQLNLFLTAARDALQTVKSLTLTLPDSGDTFPCDDCFGLSGTHYFCPSVQHLSIKGSLDPNLLQLFDSTVTKLELSPELSSNWEVKFPEMHKESIERLHTLLPCLKELALHGYQQLHPYSSPSGVALPYNLTGLISLEHLNLHDTWIHSDEMWASFPKGLQRLTCRGVECGPQLSTQHDQLQVVRIMECSNVSLTGLAGMLSAMPKLHRLESEEPVIKLDFDAGSVEDGDEEGDIDIAKVKLNLTLIESLHAAGVVPQTFSLCFGDSGQLPQDLQELPVMCSISEVVAYQFFPGEVDQNETAQHTAEVLQLLVSVFPSINNLSFRESKYLDDEMLMFLLPLQKLRRFAVRHCPKVTGTGLTKLFCQLPSLQTLCYKEFIYSSAPDRRHVSDEDLQLLQSVLASMGRQIFVNEA